MLETFFAALLGFLASFGVANQPVPEAPVPPSYESVTMSSEHTATPPEDQDPIDEPATNANGYPIVGG